jgi:phosphohistidine phosphatase SixA
MELTFFRHGIAVDRIDPQFPVDFERPLTIDGKNKVEGAVRGLKALGVKPQAILTSPYIRCAQTAALAARGLDLPRKGIIESDSLVPGADPAAFWSEVQATPRERVLIVGHGDTLEPIAGLALGFPFEDAGGGEGSNQAASHNPTKTSALALRVLHLKKAGAMQLDVPVGPGDGARLVWLLSPRVLRQIGRA